MVKGKGESLEARKGSAEREGGGGGGELAFPIPNALPLRSSTRLNSPIPLPLLAPATQARAGPKEEAGRHRHAMSA